MYIYLIVNHITGKYYVGQHKGEDLKRYFQKKFSAARHACGSSHLFNSMRKHPLPCDWSIHALLSDIQTRPELDAYERDFIAFLHSQDPEYGYNICRGGEGFTGPFTVEHRAKLSLAAKVNKNYLRAAETTRGVPRPLDVRSRISKSNMGKVVSLRTRDKLRVARLAQPDPRLGMHHSEVTKKRMSDDKKGMLGPFRGKHHTAKSKNKIRRARVLDLEGRRFGNVVPISIGRSSSRKAYWLVRCVECGVEGVVRSDRIRNGNSRFMSVHKH